MYVSFLGQFPTIELTLFTRPLGAGKLQRSMHLTE